ncbi:unnamed protein product [Cochlearia groenlandica]
MVDIANKKRKAFISEEDIATLLQRYDTVTILKLLQEMAYHAKPKIDWDELVKKTSTGITNARDYRLLWRHLAYRNSLDGDDARLQDDDSDMECELKASPAVGVDAVVEATAHVKVIAASYVPSESDVPEDSTFEAPLTINVPYGPHRVLQEPSDSSRSSRGMNITFPVLLPKVAEGHNGNGVANNTVPRKRRKKWSAEEDEELIAAVKRYGEGSWAVISKEEFEGEVTHSQLAQRWGAIRRRCDISNTSTQSGQQRAEAQIAANRALSLAVGSRLPSKKLAVGTPPLGLSGSVTGPQANGSNGVSSLQGLQQSQPVVQALPRAATASAPTAKPRVTGKKTSSNSTSRAQLMVTANSVAAAACMSGLTTSTSVLKIEQGKKTVATLVPKAEPVKTISASSLPRSSSIVAPPKAEPVKTDSATSAPRPSSTIAAPKAEKSIAAATSDGPTAIKHGVNGSPNHVISSPPSYKPSPMTPLSKASTIHNSSVNTGSAPTVPRSSSTIPETKAEPGKSVTTATNTQPSRHAVNGISNHLVSSPPSFKPSPMTTPLSKGSKVPSGFASSRLALAQRAPVTTVMPQKLSATASSKPIALQKDQAQGNRASPLVTATVQPNKIVSTNSAVNIGKPGCAKVEPPPSLTPKNNQVVQAKVGSCTDKSPASCTVGAVAESKPKDDATATGTVQKKI